MGERESEGMKGAGCGLRGRSEGTEGAEEVAGGGGTGTARRVNGPPLNGGEDAGWWQCAPSIEPQTASRGPGASQPIRLVIGRGLVHVARTIDLDDDW